MYAVCGPIWHLAAGAMFWTRPRASFHPEFGATKSRPMPPIGRGRASSGASTLRVHRVPISSRCVYTDMCIHKNMRIYTHAYMCICIGTHMRALMCRIYVYIYIHIINTCIHIYRYVYTYVHSIYAQTRSVCVYIYIYTYTCVYVYIYMHTYDVQLSGLLMISDICFMLRVS